MHKLLFLLLLTTTTLTAQQTWEENTDWLTTQNIDGRFRVESPGPLREALDTVTTAVGDQVYHTLFFKAPEDGTAENLIYVLSYVDYPEGALADSTDLIDELLKSTQDGAVQALSGELIYTTEREVADHPGRLWRINYKDGQAVARALAFVIGDRYYEMKTFGLAQSGLSDASDRFFKSFRYLTRSDTAGGEDRRR